MSSSGTFGSCPIDSPEGPVTFSGMRGKEPLVLVYQATNLINGKRYIGVTRCGLATRKSQHLYDARRGKINKFCSAIRRYGERAFVFSVVCECSTYEEALRKEVELIGALRPAYNLTSGGEGNHNLFVTEEARRNISIARRKRGGTFNGRKHSEKTKDLIRQQKLGKPNIKAQGKRRSPEIREKFRQIKLKNPSRYWLGKKRDPETIRKISETKKGKCRPQLAESVMEIFRENMRRAARARKRSVRCLDDGMIFECAADAAKHYGLKTLSISSVCGNPVKRKTLYGRRFEYAG